MKNTMPTGPGGHPADVDDPLIEVLRSGAQRPLI